MTGIVRTLVIKANGSKASETVAEVTSVCDTILSQVNLLLKTNVAVWTDGNLRSHGADLLKLLPLQDVEQQVGVRCR